ncbi:C40 family peptidase [Paenibacillus chartarius]|uniref:C40 family peptidase n=1 Tax=Paenibacillus chartarius TaxID=747481 RepID=A0ABV6DU71_9BACL
MKMNKRIVTMFASVAVFLSLTTTALGATGTVERSVNFRSAPSTSSSVYGLLKTGTTFTLVEKVNSYWYKISVNGKTGYVSPSYVKLNSTSSAPAPAPASTSSTKADQVISNARSLLGKVTYEYGTNNAPRVMDCSAFTKYVFGQEGISLRWGTRYQKDAGSYVSRSNLQKGDLVFFRVGSSSGIGHVGIYIGNGQMIHNSPSNQGGVGITSITSGYWADRYVTARRVL